LNNIVKPKAIDKIKYYINQGHKVVIVTASIECWLRVWCDNNNLELIATKLEVKNKTITGKFETKNCYGPEKVNRINEVYNLSDYDYIYAYGDSRGDKEMLAIADKRYYKYFE
jgi:HAD superfamily phosphoserine phosphatase-like hydrolase